ncbi:MAG: insulinase family protein [Candidatus Kapabacteria bacterium]|nr:insulinase family protein [Candidatus Kapabacteria bacterium]
MRYTLVSIVLVLAALSARAQPVPTLMKNDPAHVRFYTFPNGLRLYVSVDKVKPRIQSIIAVHAGSKNDPSDATGLAHYLEHMLFKGTNVFGTVDANKELPMIAQIESLYEQYRATTDKAQRSALYHKIDSVSGVAATLAIPNEYDKMCQALGCEGTNAFTSTDITAYVNDIPANQLKTYFAMEAERFRAPVLRLFHTELEAVYEEKNISLDEDYSLVNDTLMAALFSNHPYGTQSTLGTTQHLKNPSMKRIREYFTKYYQPSNMVIILAGDLDPQLAAQIVGQTFGAMPSTPAPSFNSPTVPPLKQDVVKTVVGPDAEWLVLGYAWPGAKHPDIPALRMVDMLLSNSKVGFIDLNLRQSQKVLGASSTQRLLADYGYNELTGRALPGQTLEEVRALLIEQIDHVKNGDFEDWMLQANVREMRKERLEQLQSHTGKAFYILESLSLDMGYGQYIVDLDEMAKVTKDDVVRVANTYYRHGVTIYKRTGERTDIEKVDKPAITAVTLNRDTSTTFARSITNATTSPIEPVFLDYDRDIQRANVRKDIPLLAIRNTENDLYDLTILIKNGSVNDRFLSFALGYLRFLATSKMSNTKLLQEQFRLGMTFGPACSDRDAFITMRGLGESFEESLQLMESILTDCVGDEVALKAYKERTKKSRKNALKDKNTILYRGLMPYAMYGANNSTMNSLTDAEIDGVTMDECVGRIKDFLSWPHEILYFGPQSAEEVADIIRRNHKAPAMLHAAPSLPVWKALPLDKPEVIIVDQDMVQAEIYMFGRSLPKYDTTYSTVSRLFGSYFDGGMGTIVFQTLRESKALAYSTGSYLQGPSDTTEPYVMTGFIGTQADKLIEAIDGLRDLLHTLPEIPSTLENARASVKQSIASERIVRDDILWNYVGARRFGRKDDDRKNVYANIDACTMQDLQTFYAKAVMDRCKVIAILADVEKIDMKALEKYGNVRVVRKSELFPYSE